MFGVASDVVVGAGVFAESSGPAHFQMMTSMASSMATTALDGPRRLAMRRYFAPR